MKEENPRQDGWGHRVAEELLRHRPPPFALLGLRTSRLFPELRRMESRKMRRRAWLKAFGEASRTWRGQVGGGVAGFAMAVALMWLVPLGMTAPSPAVFIGLFLAFVIAGWISTAILIAFCYKTMSHSLRRQLSSMGKPTCVRCGYNLTGNVSGRCPECGEALQEAGREQ